MQAFDILGDPVRRRILELLGQGERGAGELVAAIGREFGISQPAVSQHLRVLRESGFATVRADAQKRLYSLRAEPFAEVEQWLAAFHQRKDKPSHGKKPRKAAKKGRKRKKDKAALAKLPKVPKVLKGRKAKA